MDKIKVWSINVARYILNNIFYILGFLIIFGTPLYVILKSGIVEKPAGWGVSIGMLIPLACYLVFFFKWFRGFINQKLGQWKAVNEIKEDKHVAGILLLTIVNYLSYGVGLLILYYVFTMVNKLSIGIVDFFRLWCVCFFIGIVLLYIDVVRHITKKGLIEYETIIEEDNKKVARKHKRR